MVSKVFSLAPVDWTHSPSPIESLTDWLVD